MLSNIIAECMGIDIKSFSGDFPVLKDISIAKNYLNDEALKILNNIVSGYIRCRTYPPVEEEY